MKRSNVLNVETMCKIFEKFIQENNLENHVKSIHFYRNKQLALLRFKCESFVEIINRYFNCIVKL